MQTCNILIVFVPAQPVTALNGDKSALLNGLLLIGLDLNNHIRPTLAGSSQASTNTEMSLILH